MAEPTQKPQAVLKYHPGPVLRMTLLNPFPANQNASAADIINRIRIYRSVFPGASPSVLEEIDLPFVKPSTQAIYDLEITDTQLGVYAATFVNALDEEGPATGVLPFVYGDFELLKSQLDTRCIEVPDSRILSQIIEASRAFDSYTARFFYPKWIAQTIDGRASYDHMVDHPIIYVAELRIRADSSARLLFTTSRDGLVDPSAYLVYNRHIQQRNAFAVTSPTRPDGFLMAPGDGTGGLTNPDDREGPRISFRIPNEVALGRPKVRQRIYSNALRFGASYIASDLGFFSGRQNIIVKGFFGYTEPDLSTPLQVCQATELLALRNAIIRYGDEAQADYERVKHKTIMEKTDTHTWMGEAKDRLSGSVTGDPEIDRVIANYRRPGEASVV